MELLLPGPARSAPRATRARRRAMQPQPQSPPRCPARGQAAGSTARAEPRPQVPERARQQASIGQPNPMHVTEAVLQPMRERYGEPKLLEWEGEISEYEHGLATYNPKRMHDVTLFILNGERLALIRKPQFEPGVWRAPRGGARGGGGGGGPPAGGAEGGGGGGGGGAGEGRSRRPACASSSSATSSP